MALTGHRIPLFATRPAVEPLLGEILERQRAVVESGRYLFGPEVEAFETEFAGYIGRRHCVAVANGTDALTIGLRALGIGPGDEVLIPAFTFFATAEGVVHAGATPVFCDIDPETQCMTRATAEPAISDRTRALLPVHIFGNVAPMDELSGLAEERGLVVLEDAAQAAGATLNGRKAGAWGAAAGFSFYPGKNLGAFGDAGGIVTDDDEVADAARRLRHHGAVEQWLHAESGYTSRLDELQAATLRVLLPRLDEWTAARRRAAATYREAGLGGLIALVADTDGCEPAHHLFVGLTPDRDRLIGALADAGIEARAYYTTPMHRQPALAAYASGAALPNAERLAREGIALPMGPALDESSVRAVVAEVGRALSD
jgi:UDP-N-acetyl-3-dehydro-alpha-D-glucosamine 3-aminotranferase